LKKIKIMKPKMREFDTHISEFIKWTTYRYALGLEDNGDPVWIEIGPMERHKKMQYTTDQLYEKYKEEVDLFLRCTSVGEQECLDAIGILINEMNTDLQRARVTLENPKISRWTKSARRPYIAALERYIPKVKNLLPADTVSVVDGEYIVECDVCKQQYINWAGSTPCCGSIAWLIEDGIATKKLSLFTMITKSNI
jgi:hypothetical protein